MSHVEWPAKPRVQRPQPSDVTPQPGVPSAHPRSTTCNHALVPGAVDPPSGSDGLVASDVAGSPPNNGLVVGGVRTFLTDEARSMTPANVLAAVLGLIGGAGTDPRWFVVYVCDADTGSELARRRFGRRRAAQHCRAEFLRRAAGLPRDPEV